MLAGLVKQLDGSRDLCGTFVGTMLYLSPERLRGEQFGYSSDIWSMGILVYFIATGALPFKDQVRSSIHQSRLFNFWSGCWVCWVSMKTFQFLVLLLGMP